jgi:hypothetical protein
VTDATQGRVPRFVYILFGLCFGFIGWFVYQYVGRLDARFEPCFQLLGGGGASFVLGGLLPTSWRATRWMFWVLALLLVAGGLVYWFLAPSGW